MAISTQFESWRRRMADFQATCGSSSAEDEGQRLRDAVRLFSGKAASDGAEVRRLVEA